MSAGMRKRDFVVDSGPEKRIAFGWKCDFHLLELIGRQA